MKSQYLFGNTGWEFRWVTSNSPTGRNLLNVADFLELLFKKPVLSSLTNCKITTKASKSWPGPVPVAGLQLYDSDHT